jgi:hypothetical protein
MGDLRSRGGRADRGVRTRVHSVILLLAFPRRTGGFSLPCATLHRIRPPGCAFRPKLRSVDSALLGETEPLADLSVGLASDPLYRAAGR